MTATSPGTEATTANARVHRIAVPRLRRAMQQLVQGFGSAPAEVDEVVDNLLMANLTGHDSHGIGMLPRYAEAFAQGDLTPNAQVEVTMDGGALLRLDGQAGFGQVIGRQAMDLGLARTRQHGHALVALGNSHHLGRIGAWAEQVAEAGCISIHFVNVLSRGIVAPHGGAVARYGTNPFCVGVPVQGGPPVILDFATSVIAQGKTRVAHNRGERLPPDCVIDAQGQASDEPRHTVVPPFGALLPMGGPLGMHKGWGLALVCELLGGALASGRTQRDDRSDRRRVLNGMFSILVDPAAMGGGDAFWQEVSAFIDWAKAAPPRTDLPDVDRVQVAGEPEREKRAARLAAGLDVDATTWDELRMAAQRLGVDPQRLDAAAFGDEG